MAVTVEDQYGNTVTTRQLQRDAVLEPGRQRWRRRARRQRPPARSRQPSGGVATFSGLSIVNPANPSYSAAGTGYSLHGQRQRHQRDGRHVGRLQHDAYRHQRDA